MYGGLSPIRAVIHWLDEFFERTDRTSPTMRASFPAGPTENDFAFAQIDLRVNIERGSIS